VVAGRTARLVTSQLPAGCPPTGDPDPIVRQFTEFDHDDPNRVTMSGVAFPYYAAIYLNTGLKTVDDVRWTAAHETAHLAGAAYDSEDAADGFAARFTGLTGTATRGGGNALEWHPNRASISTNVWELRTA
jgi:hypothetical protein